MKKLLFVSDFDGTISAQDFYLQILYRYEPHLAFSPLADFYDGKYTCLDFLGKVFREMNLSKEELDNEISKIPADETFKDLVDFVHQMDGDVVVLSAGCNYYIQKKLEVMQIHNVQIISNVGTYQDGGLIMRANQNTSFHSAETGIDKRKVVSSLKDHYQITAYAGDGWPDYEAMLLSDIRFAKPALFKRFEQNGESCYSFNSFDEALNILKERLS